MASSFHLISQSVHLFISPRRLKQTVCVSKTHIFPSTNKTKKKFQTAFQCRQIRIVARLIKWVVTVTRKAKSFFFFLLFTAAAEATRRQFRRVWRTFQWQQRVRGAKSSSSRCCRSSIFEFGGVETVGAGGRMAPGPRRRTGMRLGGLPNI